MCTSTCSDNSGKQKGTDLCLHIALRRQTFERVGVPSPYNHRSHVALKQSLDASAVQYAIRKVYLVLLG
jgi:hypothetical protein